MKNGVHMINGLNIPLIRTRHFLSMFLLIFLTVAASAQGFSDCSTVMDVNRYTGEFSAFTNVWWVNTCSEVENCYPPAANAYLFVYENSTPVGVASGEDDGFVNNGIWGDPWGSATAALSGNVVLNSDYDAEGDDWSGGSCIARAPTYQVPNVPHTSLQYISPTNPHYVQISHSVTPAVYAYAWLDVGSQVAIYGNTPGSSVLLSFDQGPILSGQTPIYFCGQLYGYVQCDPDSSVTRASASPASNSAINVILVGAEGDIPQFSAASLNVYEFYDVFNYSDGTLGPRYVKSGSAVVTTDPTLAELLPFGGSQQVSVYYSNLNSDTETFPPQSAGFRSASGTWLDTWVYAGSTGNICAAATFATEAGISPINFSCLAVVFQ